MKYCWSGPECGPWCLGMGFAAGRMAIRSLLIILEGQKMYRVNFGVVL